MRKSFQVLGLLGLTIFVASDAVATKNNVSGAAQVPGVLVRKMLRTREAYIQELLRPLRDVASNHQDLTAEDIAKEKLRLSAVQRLIQLKPFLIADLDGDGKVTADEWQATYHNDDTLDNPLQEILFKQTRFQYWDTDHDGTATMDEALAALPVETAMLQQQGNLTALSELLELDPNGDGKLTATELEELGRKAYAVYDQNGDGIISQSENTLLAANQLMETMSFGATKVVRVAAIGRLSLARRSW